jgi:DNA repair protein RecO (recombination protein O)
MLGKTKGIVLNSIPYNDKYNIICIYTEMFGRVSYMTSRARSKRSSISKAVYMPLSIVDMEVEHKPHQEIQRIKEAKIAYPLNLIYCDPIKNVLTLFLSEVLFRTLKETEQEKRLYQFIEESIRFLEISDAGVANFHIMFLIKLTIFLGIHPNAETYKEGSLFDMINGVFTTESPTHRYFLNKGESLVLARILKMDSENLSLYRFSRKERTAILNKILEYYRLHIPNFPEIKSLAILQSLYD